MLSSFRLQYLLFRCLLLFCLCCHFSFLRQDKEIQLYQIDYKLLFVLNEWCNHPIFLQIVEWDHNRCDICSNQLCHNLLVAYLLVVALCRLSLARTTLCVFLPQGMTEFVKTIHIIKIAHYD